MKDFKLIEHNLIPSALFVLNISVVHLIYLLFMNYHFASTTMLVFCSTGVIIAGVVLKKKFLMVPASIIYLITLAYSF